MPKKIIVSACLAGVKCRYDGGSNENKDIVDLVNRGKAVTVCSECLGGLPTPRVSCEIQWLSKDEKPKSVEDLLSIDKSVVLKAEGKKRYVVNKDGIDCTKEFDLGAKKALDIAKIHNAEIAILQERSPSCGCGKIYDGTFSKNLIEGKGLTAELFEGNGIKVCNINNYQKYLNNE